jgi:hypothetical protein
MKPHIEPRRIWEYVHFKLELKQDELVHVAECSSCLDLFQACARADSPDQIDLDDPGNKRSA